MKFPIKDFFSKCDQICRKWLIYDDNTVNLRHNFFHILFSTFLKTFFTLFPSVQPRQVYFL